jgi:hypothetical protein
MAQCFVVVPSDRIKCQLQVQGLESSAATARGTQSSMGTLRACVNTVVAADGWRVGLLRGWWPTVWCVLRILLLPHSGDCS